VGQATGETRIALTHGAQVNDGAMNLLQHGVPINSEKATRSPRPAGATGTTQDLRGIPQEQGSTPEQEALSETFHARKAPGETNFAPQTRTSNAPTNAPSRLWVKAPCLTSPQSRASSHNYASTPHKTFPARSPSVNTLMSARAAASAPCTTTPGNGAPITRAFSVMTRPDKRSRPPKPSDDVTD
jgi:hypothetical protein